VDLVGELLDPCAQLLRHLRELRVLLEQAENLLRLSRRDLLALEVRLGEIFSMARV